MDGLFDCKGGRCQQEGAFWKGNRDSRWLRVVEGGILVCCCGVRGYVVFELLRGTIVNRTYGIHKNHDISPFLLTIFGPITYGPP